MNRFTQYIKDTFEVYQIVEAANAGAVNHHSVPELDYSRVLNEYKHEIMQLLQADGVQIVTIELGDEELVVEAAIEIACFDLAYYHPEYTNGHLKQCGRV